MQSSMLGKTGLRVSRLGMGLAELGELGMAETSEAERLLNAALDGGINFLDTAACYGNSEELVGLTIAHRRSEFVLATKCGHVTGDYSGKPWSAEAVRDSIDRSLLRMKTDYLDLVQLHSCSLHVLEQGEAISALTEAKTAGKTRFVGYSGDNEEALWAINSGLFDTLQTSFSLADQHARSKLFGLARSKDMGIIIKRPIANGVWGAERNPSQYGQEYFRRVELMARRGPVQGAPEDRIMLALGFALAHPVDTAIVGTRNLEHLRSNFRLVESGTNLQAGVVEDLVRRFEEMDDRWLQLE